MLGRCILRVEQLEQCVHEIALLLPIFLMNIVIQKLAKILDVPRYSEETYKDLENVLAHIL